MELVKVLILLPFSFQIFNGNTDRNTVVINNVTHPFVAKVIRFAPLEWKDRISMRAEIFGCSSKGKMDHMLLSSDLGKSRKCQPLL